MCRIEKQKTCITVIAKRPDIENNSVFSERIYIPHQVDVIKVTSIAGYVYLAGGAVVSNDVYYITSNLVSNIHDTILGYFGNLNSINTSSVKEFTNNQPINSVYTFIINQALFKAPNTNTGPIVVSINLEFIELEK